MRILYDIDRCEEILQSIVALLDEVNMVDRQLYEELAELGALWEGDASVTFQKSVSLEEETYLKQKALFEETLNTMARIHQDYCDAKELVDRKFKEIEYG